MNIITWLFLATPFAVACYTAIVTGTEVIVIRVLQTRKLRLREENYEVTQVDIGKFETDT